MSIEFVCCSSSSRQFDFYFKNFRTINVKKFSNNTLKSWQIFRFVFFFLFDKFSFRTFSMNSDWTFINDLPMSRRNSTFKYRIGIEFKVSSSSERWRNSKFNRTTSKFNRIVERKRWKIGQNRDWSKEKKKRKFSLRIFFRFQLNEIFQSNRDKAERLVENLQAIYERLNLLDCEKRLKLPLDQSHRPTNLLAVRDKNKRNPRVFFRRNDKENSLFF